MSIVLNEYEWAEKAIEEHSLGKKPIETLTRVAKYYYSNQYTKRGVRAQLDNFLLQCDASVSLVQWADLLDRIAKNVDKYRMIQVDGVDIYENELTQIESLHGKQIKRLAFTLLCVAKYWDAVSDSNNHWVNTSDKEIMQMANINTSVKRQSMMFAELREKGFIRFSKKIDNLNVQVMFCGGDTVAMRVQDYRNLGYQYLKNYGEPYFECENCGITTKLKRPNQGRHQKYCSSCAIEVRTRQNVNSVMRHRNSA